MCMQKLHLLHGTARMQCYEDDEVFADVGMGGGELGSWRAENCPGPASYQSTRYTNIIVTIMKMTMVMVVTKISIEVGYFIN